MPYTATLTDDEVQLLTDLAGALECGMRLQPQAARFGNIGIPAAPDSSPNVNPSLNWAHAQRLKDLATRIKSSGTPAPTDFVYFGRIDISSNSQWQTIPNGAVATITANAEGNISFTVSAGSGIQCFISTEATFPNDESKTKNGSGATENLYVRPGQTVFAKYIGNEPDQLARFGLVTL